MNSLRWSVAVMSCVGICVSARGADERPTQLGDKTLVAWVTLANTSQQGGGVLTIQEGEEFDSIAFGERVPGRWMAGSDFFHRTQDGAQQAACPAETADAQTLVQVAVVYAGNRIRVYRHGAIYAEYSVTRPQEFSRDCRLLLGLRYLGAMGAIGYFAGAIEEARLYDTALDAATIAALRQDQDGGPQPLGKWTFADGTARDVMGHFPPGHLAGGARISNGKLHLNGRDAYVVIADLAPQSMFFQAVTTGGQWDTWLYWHEETYYLFLLAGPGGKWHGIGMATSPDGVHWSETGMVLSKADGVTWLGTGATWRSPLHADDGKYFLNFSEWRGPRQTIFFAESTDLLHWQRLGGDYEFVQDERWYQPQGRWDCIYPIARPGGGLYGYWTATPKPETGGQFGFGQTLDGAKWEALPPPQVVGVGEGEVGAVEPIGGKYYMMFGTGGKMVTLLAEQPSGPFRIATKNQVLLSGHTYFSRFFPTPGGLLVNHHAMAADGRVFFAPLKRAVVDDEGTLRLKWWAGNERLKHRAVAVQMPGATTGPSVVMLANRFDVADGLVLEGRMSLPVAPDAPRPGLFLDCGRDAGVGIIVGPAGVTELGPLKPDGTGFKPETKIDRQASFGPTVAWRLLLKGPLFELYLDDHLIQCWRLPAASTGRIGLLQPALATSVKAWN